MTWASSTSAAKAFIRSCLKGFQLFWQAPFQGIHRGYVGREGERERERENHIYIYIHIHTYVCVCVERERDERERERGQDLLKQHFRRRSKEGWIIKLFFVSAAGCRIGDLLQDLSLRLWMRMQKMQCVSPSRSTLVSHICPKPPALNPKPSTLEGLCSRYHGPPIFHLHPNIVLPSCYLPPNYHRTRCSPDTTVTLGLS